MSKISDEAVESFFNFKEFKRDNTRIEIFESYEIMCSTYYLHNNLIAEYQTRGKDLFITDAGCRTNLTKTRLNDILAYIGYSKIKQKKGEWYIDGKELQSDQFTMIRGAGLR